MRRYLFPLFIFLLVGIFACADTTEPYGPVVVYKLDLVNQTGPISTTTAYTIPAEGDYQILAYYGTLPGGGNCTAYVSGEDVSTNSPEPISGGNPAWGAIFARLVNGSAVSYKVTGCGASPNYDLSIIVEKF